MQGAWVRWASLVAQMVKNLPVTWETWVRSLGWEDPLEKYSGLENCMDRGAWQATVHGIAKSQTRLSLSLGWIPGPTCCY